jgi:hypothetical protein
MCPLRAAPQGWRRENLARTPSPGDVRGGVKNVRVCMPAWDCASYCLGGLYMCAVALLDAEKKQTPYVADSWFLYACLACPKALLAGRACIAPMLEWA